MSMITAFDGLTTTAYMLKPRLFGLPPRDVKVAQAVGTMRGAVDALPAKTPELQAMRDSLRTAVDQLNRDLDHGIVNTGARREAIEGAAQLRLQPDVSRELARREAADWAAEGGGLEF